MIQDWRPDGGSGQSPPGDEGQKEFSVPSISLPKGGGAIRGIGEKFAANPVTGTGSMTVPITTSPGRSGFGPQLSLAYDSGSGNGPFGFGWSLSIPAITRKTDKGLPLYRDAEESDVYLLSGAEDLVPVLQPDGSRFEDTTTRPGYTIHRYRPRIEGLFARIERWTNQATGETHWRSITRENITTLYGSKENSRIAGPGDPRRVFSWLICESFDDKGNAMIYQYKGENSQGVDLSQVHERNRTDRSRSPNRYMKSIRYGNRTPYDPRLSEGAPVTPLPSEWLFEVVFDYGEHDLEAPAPGDLGEWSRRNDPFSTYRAGFEIRTYRLCQRVLMFHHFPDEPGVGENCLVRSTDFTYSYEEAPDDPRNPVFSFLLSVTHSGYKRVENGSYLKKSLPPLEFEYSQPVIHEDIHDVDPESLENLPVGLDNGRYQWVDLDGEGLSGILTEQVGGWFYKRNLSPIHVQSENGGETATPYFGPLEQVTSKPSPAAIAGGRQQLLDLEGDGQLDLVDLAGPVPGFFERTQDEGWEPFVPFTSLPFLDWENQNLKLVDLTGDGHADLLISEDDAWLWHLSLGEAGFGPPERVHKFLDEEQGPRLIFADGSESIQIADLSGDGLGDIVRIRSGEVCYWPNLGYGRFGAKVTMDNPPWFDAPDLFDPRRIRMTDVDGSGVTDIIYLGSKGVRIYFNQSGNSWSEARTLAAFPAVDDLSSVQVIDLLGNGTACLVWSSSLPGDSRRPMRYIDLMGAAAKQKPHLLVKSANNLGAETHVHYAPSTKFYLADRLAGKPWITRLPFPVHVVERVETYDRISGNRFVTRYAYHHGYFDGVEREFRGFGMVEQFDTETMAALSAGGLLPPATNEDEASHVPPVYIKTWFHTGVYLGRERISNFFSGLLDDKDSGEYYREPGLDDVQARALLLEDTPLPADLSVEEEREACRALKGAMLRQEVYALDGMEKQAYPYSVSEQNFSIRILQPRDGNRHGVFLTHPREAVSYHYERSPADPRVTHSLTLEVDDFGNVLKSAAIGYGRRQPDLSLSLEDQWKQAQVLVMLTENIFTNTIELGDDYRAPLPAESRSYELTGLVLAEGQNRFSLETLHAAARTAEPLAYEEPPTEGFMQKRLIEQVRTLYRPDDLGASRGDPLALLPLGQVEALALPGETYRLAFTPGLIAAVYGDRATPAMFESDGRYVNISDDRSWWTPSGRIFLSPAAGDDSQVELAYARDHFFLPHRLRDPFHRDEFETEIFVAYDAYDLLLKQTRDALENTVNATNDYRALQPVLVTDPNGNQVGAAFDVLGMVAGTAVMGKPGQGLGDLLDGFEADLDEAVILDHLAAPLTDPHAILQQATTRLVTDLYAYQRTKDQPQPAPAVIYALARETHVSDLQDGEPARVQHSFSYSDGFGREIQRKIQAEPGPQGDDSAAADPRWVGSGWTVFNNKGKPVRKFEPFFSSSHHFEFNVRQGVSPVLFYDPLQRVAGKLNPNHTWQKLVFDAWRQETWDVNDTALISGPQDDPDLGDYFRRLPDTEYLPTWHAARIDGAMGLQEQAAAGKAAAHAGTPAVAHLDSLARTFLTLAHNRVTPENGPAVEAFYRAAVSYDIEGNQCEVSDAKGRIVMRYDYDLLGNVVHSISMDAGERWMLNDVTGKPVYGWDSRDHRLRTAYDTLRRPVEVYLQGGNGSETLVGRMVYGETQINPEILNLRGKVFQLFDQAGVASSDEFDFKGNLVHSGRQLAQEYKTILNWSSAVALEAVTYTGRTNYDALNRPIQWTAPHSDRPGTKVNVIQTVYNEAGLLEQVNAWLDHEAEPAGLLDPATANLHAVANIDYNVRGQRERIEYGNGVITNFEYDPLTFRLASLITRRSATDFPGDCPQPSPDGWPGCQVQNLIYTYDPAGNITHIRDDAQQTIYFRNQRIEPSVEYTCDAIYRLVEASGREHRGQISQPETTWNDEFRVNLPHPHDGQAMRQYTERYEYDEVGNILRMIHQAADGSWTRTYAYNEPSLIEETASTNNHLSSTSVGNTTEPYSYDTHGSMTKMPHLSLMQWDYLDRLEATARQTVAAGVPETTYYIYDAAGQRVRKVTEQQAPAGETPARMKERIYFSGVEFYREFGTDGSEVTLERETLHMMDGEQLVALVETRTLGEDDYATQLVRYQFGNHLGSASLELDETGRIISYEEYYPFGSTSYQAVNADIRAAAKRYRYTGKERDEETGLAYHGTRYYAGWLGRWVSADPAGLIEGSNVYIYARNLPAARTDPFGSQSQDVIEYPPGTPTPGEIVVYGNKLPTEPTPALAVVPPPLIISPQTITVGSSLNATEGATTLGGLILESVPPIAAFVIAGTGIYLTLTKTGEAWGKVNKTDNPDLLYRFDRAQYIRKYGPAYPPLPLASSNKQKPSTMVGEGHIEKVEEEPELQPDASGAGALIGGGRGPGRAPDFIDFPASTNNTVSGARSPLTLDPVTNLPIQQSKGPAVGPAYASQADAAASGGNHLLEVILNINGESTNTWWEASEGGVEISEEHSEMLGHTEQKAIARFDIEQLKSMVDAGDEVIIDMIGHFPPCPYGGGYMNALTSFVEETGVEVNYRTIGSGGNVTWEKTFSRDFY